MPAITEALKAEIRRCINKIPPNIYNNAIDNFIKRV
ncbi:unnamed protein product [Phyllotreta striolata]|uniref:Uncharacterized protein n=1 Tax=Phyllotreta striolata TaxID=444603 RepID=A0A9N9XT44_PHYSR|nr:unnamed protein product [Phyllotreta striolata]